MPGAQITAPCTGTITGWHVRGYHSVVPANVKLRVLHPNGTGQYTGAGTSSPITLGTTDAVLQASTSLPITAGDFIGLDVLDNSTFDLVQTTGSEGSDCRGLDVHRLERRVHRHRRVQRDAQRGRVGDRLVQPNTGAQHAAQHEDRERENVEQARQGDNQFIALGQASSFQCALVKAPKRHHHAPKPSFTSCRSPKRYAHLQPGSYALFVRAFNAEGAVQLPLARSSRSDAIWRAS